MQRISATLACVIATGAWAQQPPAETIEVEGHYENGLGTSDAASQGTVTAKLIENRPILRPAEVLEFVPGVVVTQHSGGGKANQYFLRGFNLDHGTDFATFVAGMPVNMPTHAHGQGYSDLNFLIPELVSRIDYFKGPYFASLGDFASAGAARIGLVTRVEHPFVEATEGERGYQRLVLARSPEVAGGTLLTALEVAANDGPWRSPEDLRRWNALVRYSRGTAQSGWNVTAMGYGARWNSTDQIPRRAVDSGLLDRFAAVDPSDAGRSARQSLSLEGRSPFAGGHVEANAFVIRSRLDLFSDFTYFLDDPVHGDQFEQAERRTVTGANATWKIAQSLGVAETSHAVGVQLRRDRLDPVGLYRTQARERLSTTREDQVTEHSAALYYENMTRWGEWVRTMAGLRHDRFAFDVASSDDANSGRGRASLTAPKVGVVLGPFARSELFLDWGRGFHSNDARGATLTVDPASGGRADRVTPLVRSVGSEIGLRVVPIPGLQSTLALWQLDLDSELVFSGDAGTTEASRPSRRKGIEWSNHYAASAHVLLDLDASISRARFRDAAQAGNFVPGAVERVISSGIVLTGFGPWSGTFQLRHFGPRPLIEDGSVRSAPTTLASARLGYRLGPAWSVGLDAFNLFDRRASDIDYSYASRLRGEPAGGVDDVHFHPVEPRSLRLTVTARF